MADLKLYNKFFKANNLEAVIKEFQKTLVDTNRSYLFFVDWSKAKRNIDSIKTEIALLSSLIGSKDFKKDFFNLLANYPEVIKALPIIIALHEVSFAVIENFDEKHRDLIRYSFNRKKGEK